MLTVIGLAIGETHAVCAVETWMSDAVVTRPGTQWQARVSRGLRVFRAYVGLRPTRTGPEVCRSKVPGFVDGEATVIDRVWIGAGKCDV